MCDQYLCSSGSYRRGWILVRYTGSREYSPGGCPQSALGEEEEKVPSLRRSETKDPRLRMPGYEVYGEMRPIMSFWRWTVASLISLMFGAGIFIDLPNSPWELLFFALFALAATVVIGFYLRRKRIPVGIKRDEERVLITGIVDSGILVASNVKLTSPTSLYVERKGERLMSKKMVLYFATAEDAGKVIDWVKSGSRGVTQFQS